MVCDIHIYAEKKNKNHEWVKINALKPFENRDYGVFGFLANVRNYSDVPPISEPRGIPDDISKEVSKYYEEGLSDAHSASWLSVSELTAYDYDTVIEDRRCTMQLGPNLWTGAGMCLPGHGRKQTLREFLGADFFVDIQKLVNAGAERIVFWFDD